MLLASGTLPRQWQPTAAALPLSEPEQAYAQAETGFVLHEARRNEPNHQRGCHNPEGTAALAAWLAEQPRPATRILVFGMGDDREPADFERMHAEEDRLLAAIGIAATFAPKGGTA